jgi:sugar lactone lactonase YvrE/4-amino-4-deoxy-L-arabinose transferase-like glycosyltransferase
MSFSGYRRRALLAATGCMLLVAIAVFTVLGQQTSFTASLPKARAAVVIARSDGNNTSAGGQLGYVTLEPSGTLAALDIARHTIIRLSSSGELLSEWGPRLDASITLDQPAGIAQADGSLFVLDEGTSPRIIRLSSQGAVQGISALAAYSPYGARHLTAGPDNTLYLPDTGNNRVLVLSLDGKLLRSIGSAGTAPGQFKQPAAAVVASDGSLFVSDLENRRIERFNTADQVQNAWPIPFNTPSIAVDQQNRIYAADADGRRVVAFSPTGDTLGEIDTGSNVDGVAVQPDGGALFALAPRELTRIDLDSPAPSMVSRLRFDWLRLAIALGGAAAVGAALLLLASVAPPAARARRGLMRASGWLVSPTSGATKPEPLMPTTEHPRVIERAPRALVGLGSWSPVFWLPPLLVASTAALAGWSAVQMYQRPQSPSAALLWAASLALYPIPWLRLPNRVSWRALWFLGGLFVVALLPRLLWVDHLPLGLHGDEARHVLVAEQILRTGLVDSFADHGWGIPVWGFLWQVAFVRLFGPSIDTVRIASSVAGALTVVLTYLWAKELAGRTVGLIAAGLIMLAHTHLMMSHLGTVNSQAPLLTTLTIWLLTISWQRSSVAAAALAASAFTFTALNWSGDRIIVPIVVAGVLYAVLARRKIDLTRPVAIFVLGAVLLAAAPAAYYLRSPDGLNLILARSDKSILHPAGWTHTLSSIADKSVPGVLARQVGGTIGAFIPGRSVDSSTFYNFSRPFMDPLTLVAAAIGLLTYVRFLRRPIWAFPPLVMVLTLISTSLIVDPPNYTRLGLMMTSTVVLAGLGVDAVRRLVARTWLRPTVATLFAAAVVVSIASVNGIWFFRDYPREGEGAFTLLAVAGLAQQYQMPVYVLTPDFNFGHEDLQLLDPARRVQPPPDGLPIEQTPAIWVATESSQFNTLQDLQRRLPGSHLQTVTDNLGRTVLQALVPS